MTQKVVARNKCPECGGKSFDRSSSRAEVACNSCGLVIESEKADHSEESRFFDERDREEKKRSGSPVTFTRSDQGFRTAIGRNGDLSSVDPGKRGQYKRLRRWNRRTDNTRQRGINDLISNMTTLVNDLSLPPSVFEECCRLAGIAKDRDLVKGRRKEHISAALVYLVARMYDVPRTISEISEASDVDERELGKNYRYLAKELDLGIKPVDPASLLPRYAEELGMDGESRALVRKLLSRAREKGLTAGRSPDSLLASAIYFVSHLNELEITQKRIARTIGVTEVTVRNNWQIFKEEFEDEPLVEA